jgi:hypothetical protein
VLEAAWADLRSRGRTALVPYFTAGHPDRAASLEALRRSEEHADIIEVGVAFSDPLADGPTIQRSTFEALASGMTLPRTLELIAEARLSRPVVVFSYLNPVRRYGLERFLRDAADLKVAGLLLTDLPAGSDATRRSGPVLSTSSGWSHPPPWATDSRRWCEGRRDSCISWPGWGSLVPVRNSPPGSRNTWPGSGR